MSVPDHLLDPPDDHCCACEDGCGCYAISLCDSCRDKIKVDLAEHQRQYDIEEGLV